MHLSLLPAECLDVLWSLETVTGGRLLAPLRVRSGSGTSRHLPLMGCNVGHGMLVSQGVISGCVQ
ncbi:MAG: hypothetical protein M3361_20495 [Candidatus Tectomicrobia bacterium]|nr:hypothetical protein [Candidatus Tectomicrobia bacterium]